MTTLWLLLELANLIVCDKDKSDTKLTLQCFQFILHLLTQFVVQRREGFI
jgi:hypothetical protein